MSREPEALSSQQGTEQRDPEGAKLLLPGEVTPPLLPWLAAASPSHLGLSAAATISATRCPSPPLTPAAGGRNPDTAVGQNLESFFQTQAFNTMNTEHGIPAFCSDYLLRPKFLVGQFMQCETTTHTHTPSTTPTKHMLPTEHSPPIQVLGQVLFTASGSTFLPHPCCAPLLQSMSGEHVLLLSHIGAGPESTLSSTVPAQHMQAWDRP